jgi:putative photosynthetic complex assembly protein 2
VSTAGLAIAHVLFLWWFSTGAILYLDGLPRQTFRWTVLGATVLFAAALVGLAATSRDTTLLGAHAGFAGGLVVWGWNEVLFLTGWLTGPRTGRCPEGARGWRRFGFATQSVLWHELAILGSALLLAAMLYDAPNQVGLWTFLLLFAMRLSTKLNVFLGVPNLSEEFLPEHLRYIASYFRRRPMNFLFPVSVTLCTSLLVLLVARAMHPDITDHDMAGCTILATLVALALLEHWFLVLPFRSIELWRWGLTPRHGEPAFPFTPHPDQRATADLVAAPPRR